MIPKKLWVKKAIPQQYTLQHTKINSLKINFATNIAYFRGTALNPIKLLIKINSLQKNVNKI